MRWTAILDVAAVIGLLTTTYGFAVLGARCGLGISLAAIWGGGWLVGLAVWTAASLPKRS